MTTEQNAVVNDTSGAILGLLISEGSTHGHEVLNVAEKWLSPYFTVTRSQVYRDLKAMAKRGLVREGKEIPKGGREYKITVAGKKAFSDWYNNGYSLDTFRNTVALRVAFAPIASKASLSAIVAKAKADHEAEIDKLNLLIREADEKELVDDAIALRFAMSYHQAAASWLSTIEI